MDFVFEMPEAMLKECDKKGTVERFEYDTFTYDEGDSKPMHKGAWVYLPYGYDAGKKYNVLYLLHGGAVNEDWWFKMFPDTVTILDNMVNDGVCEPCIIVTPTYYRGDAQFDKEKGEYLTEHFAIELRKDLIPAVEAHYSTFAGVDVSDGDHAGAERVDAGRDQLVDGAHDRSAADDRVDGEVRIAAVAAVAGDRDVVHPDGGLGRAARHRDLADFVPGGAVIGVDLIHAVHDPLAAQDLSAARELFLSLLEHELEPAAEAVSVFGKESDHFEHCARVCIVPACVHDAVYR